MSRLVIVLAALLLTATSLHAQWTEARGLYGGHVHRIVIDGATVYAGTTTRGLFRSDDAGRTWTHVSLNQYSHTAIQSIAMHGGYPVVIPGHGLLRYSVDGGRSFAQYSIIGANESMRVLHSYRGWLFVGLGYYNGIYRSTNGGVWQRATSGIAELGSNAPAIVDIEGGDAGLFVATDTALYRSLDTGRSYQRVMADVPSSLTTVVVHGSVVVVGTAGSGVLRSSDGGASWAPANDGIAEGISGRSIVAIASAGRSIFAATREVNGLYRSTDGGLTWHRSSSGMATAYVASIAGDDSLVIAGALGEGIYRSTDGGATWNQSNVGLTNLWVGALLPLGNTLYAGSGNGLYRKEAGSDLWSRIEPGPDHRFITSLAASATHLFAATLDHRVFRSSDRGATWHSAAGGLPDTTITSLDTLGRTIVAGTARGVYYTRNDGESWQQARALGDSAYLVIGSDGFIFAGAMNGTGKMRSMDGETWFDVSAGMVPGQTRAWGRGGGRLAISVWTPEGNVLYTSSDDGSTWSLDADTRGSSDHVVGILPHGRSLFLAANTGTSVFRLDGSSWTELKEGRPWSYGPPVSDLALDGDALYASTLGMGVWRYRSALSSSPGDVEIESRALRVVPNPASDVAVIELGDVVVTAVTLVDAVGSIVARPARDAGNGAVRLDLAPLGTGIYHARVVTSDGVRSLPVIVVR